MKLPILLRCCLRSQWQDLAPANHDSISHQKWIATCIHVQTHMQFQVTSPINHHALKSTFKFTYSLYRHDSSFVHVVCSNAPKVFLCLSHPIYISVTSYFLFFLILFAHTYLPCGFPSCFMLFPRLCSGLFSFFPQVPDLISTLPLAFCIHPPSQLVFYSHLLLLHLRHSFHSLISLFSFSFMSALPSLS